MALPRGSTSDMAGASSKQVAPSNASTRETLLTRSPGAEPPSPPGIFPRDGLAPSCYALADVDAAALKTTPVAWPYLALFRPAGSCSTQVHHRDSHFGISKTGVFLSTELVGTGDFAHEMSKRVRGGRPPRLWRASPPLATDVYRQHRPRFLHFLSGPLWRTFSLPHAARRESSAARPLPGLAQAWGRKQEDHLYSRQSTSASLAVS